MEADARDLEDEGFFAEIHRPDETGSFTGKVFVDCTRSDEVAKAYADILESNISIVTRPTKSEFGFI